MTTKNKPARFIPLPLTSQSTARPILYYDSEAPLDSLFEYSFSRLNVACNLLSAFNEADNKSTPLAKDICLATNLLVHDILVILEEFSPIALQLRREFSAKK